MNFAKFLRTCFLTEYPPVAASAHKTFIKRTLHYEDSVVPVQYISKTMQGVVTVTVNIFQISLNNFRKQPVLFES